MESLYRGHRFPSEIISRAVWLYHRFALSLRDVEDLLAERGVIVSYETIPGVSSSDRNTPSRSEGSKVGWAIFGTLMNCS